MVERVNGGGELEGGECSCIGGSGGAVLLVLFVLMFLSPLVKVSFTTLCYLGRQNMLSTDMGLVDRKATQILISLMHS